VFLLLQLEICNDLQVLDEIKKFEKCKEFDKSYFTHFHFISSLQINNFHLKASLQIFHLHLKSSFQINFHFKWSFQINFHFKSSLQIIHFHSKPSLQNPLQIWEEETWGLGVLERKVWKVEKLVYLAWNVAVEEDRQGKDIEEEIRMHMNINGVHPGVMSLEIQLPKGMQRQRYLSQENPWGFGFLQVRITVAKIIFSKLLHWF